MSPIVIWFICPPDLSWQGLPLLKHLLAEPTLSLPLRTRYWRQERLRRQPHGGVPLQSRVDRPRCCGWHVDARLALHGLERPGWRWSPSSSFADLGLAATRRI